MTDLKETLARLSAEATAGEWDTDTEKSEGEYGTGPDTHSGFDVTVIYGPDGKSLFDPHNSDMIEVHEDSPDEDGYVSAWDETSRRNATFITALVNAYRANQLCVVPSVEDMALALAWARFKRMHPHRLGDPNAVHTISTEPTDFADAQAAINLLTGEA